MATCKMLEASQKCGNDWWNDSCNSTELQEAVNCGAVGCTSNPVILLGVLKQEADRWNPVIDKMIADNPTDTELDLANKINCAVTKEAATILQDVHKKSGGKKGYLSAQVNPQLYRSTEKMVAEGLELASQASNVMIKCPANVEGIAAMEELTYQGVSINATLSFTTSQAVAAGEAVERGLKRREKEGKPVDNMGPVITVMVGRVDDALRKIVDTKRLSVDPGHLNWGGVAVFRNTWQLFKKKNLRALPLAAAHRCHFHWSEVLGEKLVTSIPYRWWKQYNSSDIIPVRNIDQEVDPKIMLTLKSVPGFESWYEDNGLKPEEFVKIQPSKDTLIQFLTARQDMVALIRSRMVQ